MAHRIFRLSISLDDAPDVRRVVDFDGRSSLHDVHKVMLDVLEIGDGEHLYAFFLSGKYWDQSSQYTDPRTDGPGADRALLFRLRLRPEQRFVYVYDFGAERRYSLTVVSVTESDAPLPSAALVESVGHAPRHEEEEGDPAEYDSDENDEDDTEEGHENDTEEETGPDRQALFQLATVVQAQLAALAGLAEDAAVEETRPLLREAATATLALMSAIDGNFRLFAEVDGRFGFVDAELLDLPAQLSSVGETDLALRVAEAVNLYAPGEMDGEIALIHARAGNRQRALDLVLANLEKTSTPFRAEANAGDVYRELGELDAAEAYYRRALAIAESPRERSEATLRITSFLIDTGREAEAAAFVAQQREAANKPDPAVKHGQPSVGRNDPCPCGSGKKYKKCHGA